MDTNALKKFAAAARTLLIDQVSAQLDLVLAEGSIDHVTKNQEVIDVYLGR